MSVQTGIEWTDSTWNPIRGCSLVSEGCRNCYAMGVAARFSGPGQAYEGLARRRSNGEPQWTGKVAVVDRHMLDPLRWKEPRRIFVNSMSDLFHENVSDETIDNVFAVMALAGHHTFQLLTKRPERMREAMQRLTTPAGYRDAIQSLLVDEGQIAVEAIMSEKWAAIHDRGWDQSVGLGPYVLPNLWLGVSVENQVAADERIPLLLQTPAAVRFLSCEPLLGPIDFDRAGSRGAEDGDPFAFSALNGTDGCEPPIPGIDWVIVGGESGPHARPMHPDWARSLRDQCVENGVPFFFKQWGEWVSAGVRAFGLNNGATSWIDSSGQIVAPSPDDSADCLTISRVGKKAAGRELDGRTWDEFPATAPAVAP